MPFRVLALGLMLVACSNANMGPGPSGSGGGGNTSSAGGGGGSTSGTGGGSAVTEVCDDHVDNDGDTFIDCADQDCFTNSKCFITCSDLCSDGTSICDSNGVRQCALDPM